MGHSSAAARHPEVAALVQAAAAGRHPPVCLFTGDPFETGAAAHALLAALVPDSRRAFNLETYDGRTVPITAVIDSLRTPGFCPGVKAVWVRESTLFLSGEKRADVSAALFAAWNDGRQQEAAEKLLTLVALVGWSQEQFRDVRWSALSKTRLREVFGDELQSEQVASLEAVHAAALARELTVTAYRDDSGALLAFLDAGVPEQAVLLFTASTVDARKRLVKRLRELGAVVDLSVARERSGALSREAVDALVRHTVRDSGKQLAPGAHDAIVKRAGTDQAMLASELEKLCLSVGERASITEADVTAVMRDMAESWIFDFTGALSTGHLARALPLLRGLFAQGEPPLRLLAMIAREIRMLLVARECLDDSLRGVWRGATPFNLFQTRILPHVDAATRQAFGNAHPFVVYRRLQDAARIDARRLRAGLIELSDLDLRLKSSRGDPALLLEAFVINWCRPKPVETRGRPRPSTAAGRSPARSSAGGTTY
jgi:DNA polymerase III subunit delta